ncbi:MAG: ferric reductase-like transmembrane domain-containing protein [Pseudomonadota bacterium]
MVRARAILIWAAVTLAVAVPIAAAAASPLLAWREPVYIAAGFAGVIGLALMLFQPLLMGGYLPGFEAYRGRRAHRWIGGAIVLSVVIHVAALWVTSPPDVVDALLFVSPTPFSAWGVIAMWAVFGAALLAAFRKKSGLRPRTWRIAHTSFAVIIVAGTVAHALLIEGTMETISKVVLCALVVIAVLKVMADLRVWATRRKPR